MKILKPLLITAISAVSVLALPDLSQCQAPRDQASRSQEISNPLGFINVPSLRVRAEPDEHWAKVAGHLQYGEMVFVLNELFLDNLHWYKISKKEDPKMTGWVRSFYIGQFNKPETITHAIDRLTQEINTQLQQKPNLSEAIDQPLGSSAQNIISEELKWVVAGAIAKQKSHVALYFICLHFTRQSNETRQQGLISLATLLHPSEVFSVADFRNNTCADFVKTPLNVEYTPQEKLLVYKELWSAF